MKNMIRFVEKTPPMIAWSVWTGIAIVFAADHFTAYGVAVYMLHIVPMALSFSVWKPKFPFLIAAVATLAIIVAYFTTPDGVGRELSEIRRGFAVATLWILAGIGHQFIRIRLVAKREAWLQHGVVELGKKLVGESSSRELGENILGFLGDYLGAQAGAFFMDEEGYYAKKAVYSTTAGSVPDRFLPGEGYIGQAVKDVRQMVVSDVPHGYLKVGSSLGDCIPAHLLIVPFSLEGKANSVIELGFFTPIKESDVELLKRAEFSIAVAVRSVKYRTNLQSLLEETQQQSEEVQAQSEELRVSNEELEEQGNALRESQSRLENQHAELEQANVRLEEQTLALERQKNDLETAKANLESQADEISRASRYKSDFLANMSHELRTPLNSSLILAKLLAANPKGNLTPEQVKYALTIESAGNDLLNLINDVLDLSKIEAGHMVMNPEPVKIHRLLVCLRDTFSPIAAEKSLELRIETDSSPVDEIETDPLRLEQVLKNLMSNALKFTERGTVTVSVSKEGSDAVAFSVKDTGIGIAPEKQRAIFEPFLQADGTTARKYGGTGLGLSISQNLVELLGGRILVESTPDHGSTFKVIIPTRPDAVMSPAGERTALTIEKEVPDMPVAVAPPSPAFADDRETLSGAGRLILAVEDDVRFASIIYELAHELHFECLVATTAEEGLSLARQFEPNAIVLDVGLPDNSGLIVLERLKADARTRHIPVHVVSANDYTTTALTLGAVGAMLKPVKREELADALRNLEKRFTRRMRRVLVVEDDPVQREAMRELLGSQDVDAVCAQTAAECLERLLVSTFDCMVLDLSLPDASGFSLLEKLSEEDAYSFPPVIVYTGRQLTRDEEQQLRRYSKSIIIKGAKSPERLLDEVTLFLHQVVSDLPEEKQRMIEQSMNREVALEGRRILVAEDDVRNVFALTSVLEGRGVKIRIARNGLEAITALEASAREEEERIDLVLMDIMMPEMDGLTAIRELRKRREWSKLPIIALTAKAMKSDQVQCLQAGANDYLSKPLDVEKLLSLIRVWMPR